MNNAAEAREYLIEELKKQLVGPGMSSYEYYSKEDHQDKYEILTKSPRKIYTAGVLFPQGEMASSESDNEYENEETSEENLSTEDNKSKSNYLENDDEEKTADNNFDLDLTNELRASAMGLSVLISTNKPVVIGVNDIGKYKKISKEASRGLLEACCYLSKYEDSYKWFANQFKLEKNSQDICHKFLEKEVLNHLSDHLKLY